MSTMVHSSTSYPNEHSVASWHPYSSGIGYRLYSHRKGVRLQTVLQILFGYLFKVLLIGLVSIGFLFCASAILAASVGIAPKVVALAAWACGFVPISHHLWNR